MDNRYTADQLAKVKEVMMLAAHDFARAPRVADRRATYSDYNQKCEEAGVLPMVRPAGFSVDVPDTMCSTVALDELVAEGKLVVSAFRHQIYHLPGTDPTKRLK